MVNYGATNRYLDDYPEQEPLPSDPQDAMKRYLLSFDDADGELDDIPF